MRVGATCRMITAILLPLRLLMAQPTIEELQAQVKALQEEVQALRDAHAMLTAVMEVRRSSARKRLRQKPRRRRRSVPPN